MADPRYRSWLEDEYYFGSFLCHNCDNEWPSWRQWQEHTHKATSRIGKAFHPLIQNTKKSKEHRTQSNYFREIVEEVILFFPTKRGTGNKF